VDSVLLAGLLKDIGGIILIAKQYQWNYDEIVKVSYQGMKSGMRSIGLKA